MTDSPQTPEPLEDPQEQEIRRLLAEARHTRPMPADVAARLDDVLAGLREVTDAAAAQEDAAGPDATVVRLASHRRRAAAGLLVAAAAIVVGGVAVAQHLPTNGGSAATTASAGADRADGTAPQRSPGRSPGQESFGNTGNKQSSTNADATPAPTLRAGRVVVHGTRFTSDALAGRRLLPLHAMADGFDRAGCVIPAGRGEVLGATYRRAPAALVYRRPSGGSQVVDLYVCGSKRPIRSATLPAP